VVKEILSPNVNKNSKCIYKLNEVNQNEENLFTQPRFNRKSEKRNKVKLTKEVIYNFNNRFRKCATSGNIQVNREYVDCLLDTGAFTSFISEEYFRKRNLIKQSIDNPKNWVTANGSPVIVTGQVKLHLRVDEQIISAIFIIVKNLSQDIII